MKDVGAATGLLKPAIAACWLIKNRPDWLSIKSALTQQRFAFITPVTALPPASHPFRQHQSILAGDVYLVQHLKES
jgi:hypothetical protein